MDDSAALVVEHLIDAAIAQDTECIVMGLSGLPAATLGALNVLRRVPDDRIVGKLDEARETAKTDTRGLTRYCRQSLFCFLCGVWFRCRAWVNS